MGGRKGKRGGGSIPEGGANFLEGGGEMVVLAGISTGMEFCWEFSGRGLSGVGCSINR